ncbi:uncharacterized protein LOC127864482 [Dreissena polymorpha]|uniref:Uncharacterized protein n=1 Tax=Dreissena polymorpha TaxID=45954 RepID=A0A9D4NHU4_DREPO|nr:uncharacterized protein LOC127864482 [Dreissena polymorpha]KAH3896823.1 hypothetical protein DPMN_021005 [Dreissena polymorpha]
MEWRAFIAACFYRKKVIGSTEFEDILGLIRVNFNQVRCTIRDNDGVICIQQDQKLKPRYCSIWVDKFNPNGSIYMQVAKAIMEWDAFIAASFYREEVVGSAESKNTLGLIRMNFNQVRGTT